MGEISFHLAHENIISYAIAKVAISFWLPIISLIEYRKMVNVVNADQHTYTQTQN